MKKKKPKSATSDILIDWLPIMEEKIESWCENSTWLFQRSPFQGRTVMEVWPREDALFTYQV